MTFAYDTDGNRSSRAYPGGTLVRHGYTARNPMNSMTLNGAPLAAFRRRWIASG